MNSEGIGWKMKIFSSGVILGRLASRGEYCTLYIEFDLMVSDLIFLV